MAAISFAHSLERSNDYPQNLLIADSLPEHDVVQTDKRLRSREHNIFTKDTDNTVLELYEHDRIDRCYRYQQLRSQNAVVNALLPVGQPLRRDPCNTFIFWRAPNSRAKLCLTKEVARLVLTFFQIKPFFIDFLFLFGFKEHAQGSHFGSFRRGPTLSDGVNDKLLPEIGRPGTPLEICFNLQGVEQDPESELRPWSIRQTVIYHKMDALNGSCTWLIVKGNQLMVDRVKKLKRKQEPAWDTISDGVTNSLRVHRMFATWAAENWTLYLDSLDGDFNAISRPIVKTAIGGDVCSKPFSAIDYRSSPHPSRRANYSLMQWIRHIGTKLTHPRARNSTRKSIELESQSRPGRPPEEAEDGGPVFTIADLQRLLVVEEKVREVTLVIEGNMRTLRRLMAFYKSITNLEYVSPSPQELKTMETDVSRFAERVDDLMSDMDMHKARSHSLLGLVANRKAILTDILNFRNAESSRRSASNTETLTGKMEGLTSKTVQETVMMRVISIVTVIFLPGTFVSTLMSTDIIHYSRQQEDIAEGEFSSGALLLFFALTLPLMAVTLTLWRLYFKRVKMRNDSVA